MIALLSSLSRTFYKQGVAMNLQESIGTAAARHAWPDRSLAGLVEHLEEEGHAVVRDLIAHTALLFAEACHTGCDTRLTTMRSAFRRMSEQLLAHIEHEELVLFPAILALEEAWSKGGQAPPGVEGGIRSLTGKLVLEHVEISRQLDELRKAREALESGDQIFSNVLAERLITLERHLHEYINLENQVAFPRAAALEDALHQPATAEEP